MAYFLALTLLSLLGLLIIRWVHSQSPPSILVQPKPAPSAAPLISVCVPARNEEQDIRGCAESILAQDYPSFEVIVLEDRSTDSTAEILDSLDARRGKLKVIHGAPLPAGWVGKPHALHQAAQAARGEWLCFVDADTFLAPEAVSACYAKAVDTGADLFTILTKQVMGTFWEKALLPIVMTALSLGFPPHKVNDPHRREAIANGQFILIKRSVYDAVGGHERIRNQIVEDKAIAEQVKWNGFRLVFADGTRLARTRMYTSLPEMWEGWTKNIYLGLRGPWLLMLGAFGAALSVIAAVFLPAWSLLGYVWWQNDGGPMALAVLAESFIVWGYLFYQRARIARAMDISGWWALTTPLGAAVFAAMMLTSAWKVLSGRGVAWKGRHYGPGST